MPEIPVFTIVLPHREIFSPQGAGAVAMVVRRLAAGGSRHRVRVMGPPLAGPPFPEAPFIAVRPPRFLPLTVTQRYALGLTRALARLPPGPVEVHNKPDVASWLARLLPGRPVSLFLHNDPREMRGARSASRRGRLLTRLAGVACVSGWVRDALLDGVEGPAQAPWVLPNTLDPTDLPPLSSPEARDQLILFAGRVVPDKAPDAFVAACARALPLLPGWRAQMIGADGFRPGAADSRFVARLRPAAAAAGVAMLGLKPHAEVLAAMARAAIVVVPSRWPEPFGLTALEAMACGAALVCSHRGGLAEVAGGACVLIDPDDADGMGSALVALAKDGPRRAALSSAGLDRARARFATAGAVALLDAERDRVLAGWRAGG